MMKNKKFLILILVIIIAVPISIICFQKFTKPNVPPEKPKEVSKEEPKTSEEAPKIVDRFQGKTLVVPKSLTVLTYHAMGDDKTNTLYVSKEKFKEQMDYLKNNGYFTLNYKEFEDYIVNNKPIPEKSIFITFDDGYDNNYSVAYPILKENSQNVTLAMITNYLDKPGYMSKEQVSELSKNGWDIVSHTTEHQSLDQFGYDDQLKFMKESKKILEDLLGTKVTGIIYPYGKSNKYTKKALTDSGYTLGFDLAGGMASPNNDHAHINRRYVSGAYDLKQFINVLHGK